MDHTQQTPSSLTSKTVLPVIFAASFVHMMNDLIQTVLPSIYPLLKQNYQLSFHEVGLITLVYQLTASILQPAIGFYTDKHPKPYLLPFGMCFTLLGIILLAFAHRFEMVLVAAALTGLGSSTFHPEASRVARMASGGKFGFAQSSFQVGGNAGSAFGPLLAAAIIIPYTQKNILWFCIFALLGIVVLFQISRWVVNHKVTQGAKKRLITHNLTKKQIVSALIILSLLVFSKYVYMVSLTNYYTFYLIDRFELSTQTAQLYLFLFLAAVAIGTFAGGPIGDRIGRKWVIWISILGVAPFTLLLPYANLFWTACLSIIIGLILSSAFSAIVVFAQELIPGKVGMISGLMFGLMFGISGIAAAILGEIADNTSIEYIYKLCSFFPLIGIIAFFLPTVHHKQ
ncbi:MFS transporter [Neisseria sp. Ec49-e6-T10]|uniref:MFS transporter n=1 Tax=Neisseria sp. Ec49-e6-T10 TaxID=3140744 RepID=UPI003EB835C5